MWRFLISPERVEGKEERRKRKRERERERHLHLSGDSLTDGQIQIQHHRHQRQRADAASVCSHACVLLFACVNVCVDEAGDELRGGAQPAAQRQTAGCRFKSWGLAPAGLCICLCTVSSSKPYFMWGALNPGGRKCKHSAPRTALKVITLHLYICSLGRAAYKQ